MRYQKLLVLLVKFQEIAVQNRYDGVSSGATKPQRLIYLDSKVHLNHVLITISGQASTLRHFQAFQIIRSRHTVSTIAMNM